MMLCERCQERPATVFYTEIINNKQKKMQLCEVCAGQMQAEGLGGLPQMNLHNFLASFWNQMSGVHPFAPKTKEETCPSCGTPESLFAQKGLFGCGDCYKHFGERLEPLLRRIHGSSAHTGKVPLRSGGKVLLARQIEELKAGLRDAVVREEFEKAAELRDNIKKLEQQL
ncbi:Protein-arginine kinase activator protein McsA [Desulfotomaculum arcticum]|uniref:Protein-arginine kinase activator protein McsA n=2 Tax=Desulfotruncus TaxID=2867377 RepID=A0A1I2VZ45_9FIRM|nr:Protein-arginine kinase activator protein McsA [Desulfotomaculum arcticum] [Desulfotruncus arcticus DSM 17038]